MKINLKRDWDGLLALVLLVVSFIGQAYCIVEGMKLSKVIFFFISFFSICYFIIWGLIFRRKRHVRIIMEPDSFSENDYYNRTGISQHRPHWRPKPWPRPRDQWNSSRGLWDTEE